jgi:hypothetical protein
MVVMHAKGNEKVYKGNALFDDFLSQLECVLVTDQIKVYPILYTITKQPPIVKRIGTKNKRKLFFYKPKTVLGFVAPPSSSSAHVCQGIFTNRLPQSNASNAAF